MQYISLIWVLNEQNRIALRPFQISKLRIPKIRGEVELVELEHILFLQSFHEGQVTKLFLVNNPMPISASKHLGYFKELLADYKQFLQLVKVF